MLKKRRVYFDDTCWRLHGFIPPITWAQKAAVDREYEFMMKHNGGAYVVWPRNVGGARVC